MSIPSVALPTDIDTIIFLTVFTAVTLLVEQRRHYLYCVFSSAKLAWSNNICWQGNSDCTSLPTGPNCNTLSKMVLRWHSSRFYFLETGSTYMVMHILWVLAPQVCLYGRSTAWFDWKTLLCSTKSNNVATVPHVSCVLRCSNNSTHTLLLPNPMAYSSMRAARSFLGIFTTIPSNSSRGCSTSAATYTRARERGLISPCQ